MHLISEPCSCEYCQMVDVMHGDPLLSKWEKEFVESVAEWGWHHDYTDKQKDKITEIFLRQKRTYVQKSIA